MDHWIKLVNVSLARLLTLLRLYIDGIEITQGTQYYHSDQHLSNPSDYGPDNSVPLIRFKPAWVRVYVRSLLFGDIDGVTGTLQVERETAFGWQTLATLGPQPPGQVVAHQSPGYAGERSDIRATLNFVLGAALMAGHLRLTASVEAPGGLSATWIEEVEVLCQQILRVRAVPISYNGPDSTGANILNLSAPTLADFQATSAWTLLVDPVASAAAISLASSVQLTQPLTGNPPSPGGCSQGWLNLNSLVQQAKIADGNRNDVVYYGLLPTGVPMGPVVGCESSGVSSGSDGDQVTMAHELGHAFDLKHAPCGGVGSSADPNYPTYVPYRMGSIGEYGLDVSSGQVFSPTWAFDYMSYCGPKWTSPYNYTRISPPGSLCYEPNLWWDNRALIDPYFAFKYLPDPPPDVVRRFQMQPEPLISIVGILSPGSKPEVHSVARVVGMATVQGGQRTDVMAELVGDGGQVLATAAVFRLRSEAEAEAERDKARDAGGPYLFQALIPAPGRGVALRMVRADEELWRRDAPVDPARMERLEVEVSVEAGELGLTWQTKETNADDAEFWVEVSTNEGNTWAIAQIGVKAKRTVVNLSHLPGGQIVIRVTRHDGFDRVSSDPARITLPEKPASIAILNPVERSLHIVGRTLRLWGTVTDESGQPIESTGRWLIDGLEVGGGFDVWMAAPESGEHVCTLRVEYEGGLQERSVRFRSAEPRERPNT